MVVALTAVTIVLSYAHYFIYDPPATPIELYHNTWRVAKDNIYDQSKLKDWGAWEHKFDHLIKTEEDALRYSNELIEHLDEKYTGLLTVEVVERDKERAAGHYIGIGVELEVTTRGGGLKLRRVVDGSPADTAGLKVGDVVLTVDGTDASAWTVDQMGKALKGVEGEPVMLKVRRGADELTVSVTRGKIPTPVVSTTLPQQPLKKSAVSQNGTQAVAPEAPACPTNIGYLRITSFDQWSVHEQVQAALEKLANCEALVIDLRDNPGGFVHEAVRTASLFMDEGVVTNIHLRVPEGGYMSTQVKVTRSQILLKNSYGPIVNFPVPMLQRAPNLLKGRPVVLLLNGNTASAAEMFAAALIDNGIATAVGTKTFGKGIGQTYIPVGNGHRLRITHLYTRTPAGTFLGDAGQSVSNGVKPQIRLEKFGYGSYGSAGDNQFQAAVRHLQATFGIKP